MKTNEELKAQYDAIYKHGEENHFSKFVDGQNVSEADAAVLSAIDWTGKRVLDIGCGTGAMARKIHAAGAETVVGLDYSAEAITVARDKGSQGISYVCSDIFTFENEKPFDALVTLGTMEHMEDPQSFLEQAGTLLAPSGELVVTCPHFINVRGFVWMALALLQNVPMSLSDLHFIHPWHMEDWAKAAGFEIKSMRTLDNGRGNGELLIRDFNKRLPNALRDAGLETSGVDAYQAYLESLVGHLNAHADAYRLDGATALYVLTRK